MLIKTIFSTGDIAAPRYNKRHEFGNIYGATRFDSIMLPDIL